MSVLGKCDIRPLENISVFNEMKQNKILLKLKILLEKSIIFLPADSGNLMDEICPTFNSFSCNGQKLTKFNNYLAKFPRHFCKI